MIGMTTDTAADRKRVSEAGMTASGLASAAQLIDVTPFATVTILQSAAEQPLVVINRQQMPARPLTHPHLTEGDDPVLARLWDNDDDAAYDSM